jgi:ParB-like chromosome segregation protein Spo0J
MAKTKKQSAQPSLEIKMRSIDELMPYARNSRKHSETQVKNLAKSIQEFGFTNPILIDANGGVIAGHGRVQAASDLGMTSVPTIELGHLTETQKRAYVIADNKLALDASWDLEMLNSELAFLETEDFDLSFLREDFVPDLPEENEAEPEEKNDFNLRIVFDCEDKRQMIFNELRDRGLKVKI